MMAVPKRRTSKTRKNKRRASAYDCKRYTRISKIITLT